MKIIKNQRIHMPFGTVAWRMCRAVTVRCQLNGMYCVEVRITKQQGRSERAQILRSARRQLIINASRLCS